MWDSAAGCLMVCSDLSHLDERYVAQDARIVDDNVDATEGGQSSRDNLVAVEHVVVVRNGCTTRQ
jgi:hypothetical protein